MDSAHTLLRVEMFKQLKLESVMDIIYPGKTIRNQGTKNKETPMILHQAADQSMQNPQCRQDAEGLCSASTTFRTPG